MNHFITKAMRAWGDDLPDWVRVLAEECDRTSQRAAGDRIGYSGATVSGVLGRTYTADLGAVEQAVKGALLNAVVSCPVAGELAAHVCLENQRRPFSPTNAQRVRLYKACHGGCANARK